jgi:cytochrome P450 family 6
MLGVILIGIATVFGLAYAFIRHRYSYWVGRGVYGPKPKFPFGNFNGLGTTRHQAEIMQDLYNDGRGKAPFSGVFLFTHPSIVVADLDLVKNILVKDFDYFRNRPFYYNEKDDPLSAHLFAIEDKKWKDIRSKLTPTFTSGKMKMMFETVLEIGNKMVSTINPLADKGDTLDIKDMVSRYSTDVIGSCAFGIECNSLKNPEAEFRVNGRDAFDPTTWEQLRIFFGNAFPNLARKMGIIFLRTSISDFFIGVVNETIKYRRENNYERKDFMQLLLDIQKKHEAANEKFTDLDVTAQAFLFFIAGFETSGTTMSFALYELARNQEIQTRLRNEINEVLSKHNNQITYEATNEMPYLDQVINESLRKYPAAEVLLRKVERDYQVPGTKHIIEKGTNVYIPVFGIQRDPNIFPNPETFDPDRFTEENVAKRHPFSYLPFGEGPRNCIGARFGIMQTRLGIISVLRNFQVLSCADTPDTIQLKKRSFVVASEHDLIVQVKPAK